MTRTPPDDLRSTHGFAGDDLRGALTAIFGWLPTPVAQPTTFAQENGLTK
jgi:hypothetical protein